MTWLRPYGAGAEKRLRLSAEGTVPKQRAPVVVEPKDGFISVSDDGGLKGNGPGARVAAPLIPRQRGSELARSVLAVPRPREVRFQVGASKVSVPTDKTGRARLSVNELNPRAVEGEQGLLRVDVSTPEGASAQARVLALPEDYDGWLAVSDVDDTLRPWKPGDLVRGRVQEPIPGAREILRDVDDRGVPIVYLSAGPEVLAPVNRQFLEQLPDGVFLDGGRYSLREAVSRDPAMAGLHEARKNRHLSGLRETFPRARLLGLGDNRFADPEVYAQNGVEPFIRDVHANEPYSDDVRRAVNDKLDG